MLKSIRTPVMMVLVVIAILTASVLVALNEYSARMRTYEYSSAKASAALHMHSRLVFTQRGWLWTTRSVVNRGTHDLEFGLETTEGFKWVTLAPGKSLDLPSQNQNLTRVAAKVGDRQEVLLTYKWPN